MRYNIADNYTACLVAPFCWKSSRLRIFETCGLVGAIRNKIDQEEFGANIASQDNLSTVATMLPEHRTQAGAVLPASCSWKMTKKLPCFTMKNGSHTGLSPEDKSVVATTTDYGVTFTSMVWKDNVFATQFHPEKSPGLGLRILKGFGEFVRRS